MISRQVSLLPYNTFNIQAAAAFWSQIDSVEQAKSLLKVPNRPDVPLAILGGGSNILLTGDQNLWIWKNGIKGIDIVGEEEDSVMVRFGGGEIWQDCVEYCINRNWAGIENLSLIPGCMGAAPIQNIGAYGVELKDVFVSLEAISLEDGAIKYFDLNDCEFGYRSSVFKTKLKGRFLIAYVILRLNKKHKLNTSYSGIENMLAKKAISSPGIRDISEVVKEIRRSKLPDPTRLGNAGSFFKNPIIPLAQFESLQNKFPTIPSYPAEDGHIKTSAAWLIDQSGWKGIREGNYGTYSKHALILVNYGNASGKDIWALAQRIQTSVQYQFGIELEPEVNIW